MNAFKRLRGLIFGRSGLDSNSSAGEQLAAGGRDRSMNRPISRRGRGAAGRSGRIRRNPLPSKIGTDRLKEGPPVNPQLADADVRHELVSRVRQEILAGTYDTPEKFEEALDRLASRLDGD